MTTDRIIALSEERAAALRAAWGGYDPMTAAGSPLPRVALRWDEDHVLHVPEPMLEDEDLGHLLRWCVKHDATFESVIEANGQELSAEVETLFARVRIKYDYEFWCASCVRVEDKQTKALVPFVLTPPQRASMLQRERLRAEGRPIRQIELKHRQYGSSTEKNAYVFWLQNVVTDGRHAWILSLSQGGAAEIARRYELISNNYPAWAGAVTMEGVRNAPNTRRIAETGAILGIGSSNNPQGPSGYTAHLVLISEAGKMGSTDVQSAERLITNVTSTVPRRPETCILIESTAEAVGRWFRQEVEEARKGESAYHFHFTTWTTDPSCWTELQQAECVRKAGSVETWVTSLSEYHRALITEHGACLEQVAWYCDAESEKPEPWMMRQENPTTPEEAFQYGERRRFIPPIVMAARKTCREPLVRGRLVAEAMTGAGALNGIRFEEDPRGELSIWRFPPGHPRDDRYGGLLPADVRYSNAFCAAMDIGGTWEKADFTDVPVLDRRPTTFGGPPEIVAEWHGHLDQDLAAWEAARLAYWYGRALLAVEVNSLREDMGDEADGLEPEHSLTVLDQIAPVYPNLYRRRVYDKAAGVHTEKLGWHTNKQTKPRAVDLLNRALREGCEATATGEWGGYVEREAEACGEMDMYLVLDTGQMQAAPGKKDDRVMTRAILMALHEEMPRCVGTKIEDEEADRMAARRRGSMASV